MTELDPNTLPLAVSGQTLNRVIGTQVNDEGVSSLALFPLKVLTATGGRIAKLAIATRPATPGEEQPATLTVYTDDGGSYPVKFTIPPGARGYSITDIDYDQDEVKPGEACTGRLTVSLENGTKLPPVEIHLPPGKDSLTITDTSVTQEPVEAGKPSKVTVTVTHSDGSKAVYSYEAPPGAEGFVDGEHFVARHDGKLNSPTIFYGPNESYTLTPQSDGSLVAKDDKQNILFSLSKTEGHIGDDRIATASDLKNETNRATAAEAEKLSLSGGNVTGLINANYTINDKPGTAGSAVPNTFWVDQNYATKTALASETVRAQAAEAQLVSGQGYGGKDKNVKRFWLGGDNGDRPVINDPENKLTYLATAQSLNNETARAQAAEAVKLQTVPASDNDDRLNNMVWNHTGNHLSAQLPDNSWRSFYPTDASVQALVYSDADARPTTIRTVKKGWRGHRELIIQNDGFDDFNGPSTNAVDDALNTKLSLTGGTLNGDVLFSGFQDDVNVWSGMLRFLSPAGISTSGDIRLWGPKNDPTLALGVHNNNQDAALFIHSNNSVTTSHNTSLPEIMMGGGSTGRVVMQAFRVTVSNTALFQWFSFPEPFSQPAISVVALCNDTYGGKNNAGAAGRFVSLSNKANTDGMELDITEYGFRASLDRGTSNPQGQAATITVFAVGVKD